MIDQFKKHAQENRNIRVRKLCGLSIETFVQLMSDSLTSVQDLRLYATRLVKESGMARPSINYRAHNRLAEMFAYGGDKRQRVLEITQAFSDWYWPNWVSGDRFE